MSAADEAEADRLVASATEQARFGRYMADHFPPTGAAPAQPSPGPARPAGPVDLHQGARATAEDEDAAFQRYMAENF